MTLVQTESFSGRKIKYFGILATFNPCPQNQIFDQTKLKALADDKLNVTKMIISVFDRVENIVGNGKIIQAIQARRNEILFGQAIWAKQSWGGPEAYSPREKF